MYATKVVTLTFSVNNLDSIERKNIIETNWKNIKQILGMDLNIRTKLKLETNWHKIKF